MRSFETIVPGKWILAGEHSVLRGSRALAFPLTSRQARFQYIPKYMYANTDELTGGISVSEAGTAADSESSQLELRLEGPHGAELEVLLWGLIDRICDQLNLRRSHFSGILKVHNSIPVGAGLGASAAVCVGMTRWLSHLGFVDKEGIPGFARSLEDLFHGESSGVDIAVVAQEAPVSFRRHQPLEKVNISWRPNLYLSYSGQRGVTVQCVEKVKGLIKSSPEMGASLDWEMAQAVDQCISAFAMDYAQGLKELTGGIDRARKCFHDWGLVTAGAQKLMNDLTQAGALAVKPTGSGNGGFVLSLWDEKSPPPERLQLIPCF